MKQPTYEVVGKIERYDERDNVFAREALEPGSPEETDYHSRNPHLTEIDREIGSFIKGKRDKSTSGWSKAYYQGAFAPIAHLGLPDCVDGVPLSPRIGPRPEENSRIIKALALHLGADLVGIGSLKQEWVYSHRGVLPYFSDQRANPPIFDGMPEHYTGREYGDTIVLEHPEAIAMAFAQDFDAMKAGPGEASDLEVGRVYSRSALVASQLARFIRTLGYSARAHHLRNYGVLVVPVAVDAGLGELARCGYMVSRKYGANTRISCVTTDMPLRHDEPADIEVLSNWVGDVAQQYTQYGGVRPFGVTIIFGGVDTQGSKILQVDPSGSVWAYKAVAVGAGSDAVNQRLAEKYQPDCTLDHAILLAVECLAKVAEGPPDPAKMRVATIPATTKTMTSLPQEALGEYLRRVTT